MPNASGAIGFRGDFRALVFILWPFSGLKVPRACMFMRSNE